MAKLNLSSPWVLFYHEVDAFFKNDSCVRVVYDDKIANEPTIYIYVDNTPYPGKADAIEKLLPKSKDFGECTLWITVVPSNKNPDRFKKKYFDLDDTTFDLFEHAFRSNRALSYIDSVEGVFSNPIYYVIFAKEVVQYFTDDLGDAHGVRSTLYQDIANDIFVPMDGVHYCTDIDKQRSYGRAINYETRGV